MVGIYLRATVAGFLGQGPRVAEVARVEVPTPRRRPLRWGLSPRVRGNPVRELPDPFRLRLGQRPGRDNGGRGCNPLAGQPSTGGHQSQRFRSFQHGDRGLLPVPGRCPLGTAVAARAVFSGRPTPRQQCLGC